MLDYAKLVAPSDHGGILVAPAPSRCAQAVRENVSRLAHESTIVSGKTLSQLRAAIRARHFESTNKPIVAVGHQPDFIHAGVWAKNVVAHRLARSLNGIAVHLVVDSDAPRRLSIRVPHRDGERLSVGEVPCGTMRRGLAYEQIRAMAPEELEHAGRGVREFLGRNTDNSLFPAFLRGLRSALGSDWVSQMVAGRRSVESDLGVELQDLRIQSAWWSPLAAHVILRAAEFASAYNESLAAFRVAHRVRGANRPIPDLTITVERIELPFWAHREEHPRRRVFLVYGGSDVSLFAETDLMVTISRNEMESTDDVVKLVGQIGGWSLRPRALVTTIWARLFLADYFIHGIGGAKYDRISDRIIGRFFGIPAPDFGCVTATLFLFPQCAPGEGVGRTSLRERDVEWNPQRHLPQVHNPQVSNLLQERSAAVRRSDQLRQTSPGDHEARHDNFLRIRHLGERLHELLPELREWAGELRTEAAKLELDRRIGCDREYFFALHSRENLSLLMDRLPQPADFV